jgi:hypothetical protein
MHMPTLGGGRQPAVPPRSLPARQALRCELNAWSRPCRPFPQRIDRPDESAERHGSACWAGASKGPPEVAPAGRIAPPCYWAKGYGKESGLSIVVARRDFVNVTFLSID